MYAYRLCYAFDSDICVLPKRGCVVEYRVCFEVYCVISWNYVISVCHIWRRVPCNVCYSNVASVSATDVCIVIDMSSITVVESHCCIRYYICCVGDVHRYCRVIRHVCVVSVYHCVRAIYQVCDLF